MYSLLVITVLSIVEANQEFICKPQPGCHFARCSPLWPVTVPALRERNEFPINCVKNGTDPKDEDQDKVLKNHKQMISELTDKLTEANETIKELEKHSDERSKVMASQTKDISKLTYDLVKANGKIEELEKNSDFCPLTYRGKCFWYETDDHGITCERASEICAARGGKPANIYSMPHHYMLLGYLRMLDGGIGLTNGWLGMKYNPNTASPGVGSWALVDQKDEWMGFSWFDFGLDWPEFHHLALELAELSWDYCKLGHNTILTKVVSLSDGSTATFVKWHTGFPFQRFTGCVYLQARLDPSSADQHLVNAYRLWALQGVICEI